MTAGGARDRRGIGALLRDLVEDSATLLRGETHLAKVELARTAHTIGRGVTLLAFGSVLMLLGSLALVVGLILLAGDQWLPADRYWLAALVVLVITAAAAVLLGRRGLARLSSSRLAPAQTVATLKENASWVKQQRTSGATSR